MPIEHYDPDQEPDAPEWLALDEAKRIVLIEHYHQNAGTELPNETLHATFHAIVENQVAMGGEMLPVRVKIRQLTAQGLTRHDAVHAVDSVLATHLHRIAREGDANVRYLSALRRQSARKWLRFG
jgi:hypothetical protein